jgi:hypothetical protein
MNQTAPRPEKRPSNTDTYFGNYHNVLPAVFADVITFQENVINALGQVQSGNPSPAMVKIGASTQFGIARCEVSIVEHTPW